MTARLGFLPPLRRYRALQVPERREDVQVVTAGLLRAARRAGIPVQIWIVDRPEDIRRLLAMGASGIITDRPDVAVPVAGAFAAADRRV
jgi:glycerophosphoryl diester phosphodiesterase